jgi:hypothetical protein
MGNPVPSFTKNTDAALAAIAFPSSPRGSITDLPDANSFPLHIWNDKGGGSAASMQTVKVGVRDVTGTNNDLVITGTALNGYAPMIECRSYGAQGCSDDSQAAWTPIGGDTMLDIGDIPANARRALYLRMNVPADAPGVNAGSFKLFVDYTFE